MDDDSWDSYLAAVDRLVDELGEEHPVAGWMRALTGNPDVSGDDLLRAESQIDLVMGSDTDLLLGLDDGTVEQHNAAACRHAESTAARLGAADEVEGSPVWRQPSDVAAEVVAVTGDATGTVALERSLLWGPAGPPAAGKGRLEPVDRRTRHAGHYGMGAVTVASRCDSDVRRALEDARSRHPQLDQAERVAYDQTVSAVQALASSHQPEGLPNGDVLGRYTDAHRELCRAARQVAACEMVLLVAGTDDANPHDQYDTTAFALFAEDTQHLWLEQIEQAAAASERDGDRHGAARLWAGAAFVQRVARAELVGGPDGVVGVLTGYA